MIRFSGKDEYRSELLPFLGNTIESIENKLKAGRHGRKQIRSKASAANVAYKSVYRLRTSMRLKSMLKNNEEKFHTLRS